MSKAILIEAVKKKRRLSGRGGTVRRRRSCSNTILKQLKREGTFSVTGFGQLPLAKPGARKRAPSAYRQVIRIRAGKRNAFKAGTELKGLV